MQALEFWKTITADKSNLLERLIALFDERAIRYCVIGGQAVNASAEPLVSLDLDLVVAIDQLSQVESLLSNEFCVERFVHRLNVSLASSDLRVQIQTDHRMHRLSNARPHVKCWGVTLPVANAEDVLRGKVWVAQDPTRRASKRQKDMADIARLLEVYPHLRSKVPAGLLARLV